MAKTAGRIVISTNVADMLGQAKNVFEKHQADGIGSQLNVLQGYDWSVVGPTIEVALAKQVQAEELKGQMEAKYRERDQLLPAIEEILKASRNLLKSIHAKNPKRLADWGLQVDDTPKAPKKPKA